MKAVRVLVVEDDLIIGREICQSLKRLGYEVVDNVVSADEALEVLQKDEVDLILMDINIEGNINGVEVAKVVNKEYQIPVVFLTALTDQKTLQNAKEARPYGYIVKPFTEDDIKVAVEMALFKFQMDKESEKKKVKMTKTFSYLQEAVIILNQNHQIEFINETGLQLLGEVINYSEEELVPIQKVAEFYTLKKELIPNSFFFKNTSDVLNEEVIVRFPVLNQEQSLFVKTQRLMIDGEVAGWVLLFSQSAITVKEQNKDKDLLQKGNNTIPVSWIFAKKGKRYVKVNIVDLLWIEALDNYVVLNTPKDRLTVHSTLRKIEVLLPENDFIKIHRSFVVRLDKIEAWEDGFVVVNEKLLSVSKTYQEALKERLMLL